MPPKWVQKLGNKVVHSFIDHVAVSTFNDDLKLVRARNIRDQQQIADHVIRTTKIASAASKEEFDALLNQFQEAVGKAERTFGQQSIQYMMAKFAVSTHMAVYATKPDAKARVVQSIQSWISELNARRSNS